MQGLEECQSSSGDQLATALYASADKTPAVWQSQPPINDDGQYI